MMHTAAGVRRFTRLRSLSPMQMKPRQMTPIKKAMGVFFSWMKVAEIHSSMNAAARNAAPST